LTAVDMATTALYHGRSAPEAGKTIAELRDTVGRWARDVYAPALSRASSLSDSERQSIVRQLSAYIGVPPTTIDAQKLTVSPREFRHSLLSDQGKEPYVFDMRRTSAPADQSAATIVRYLRHDVGFRTSLPYIGLEEPTQGYAPGGTYSTAVNERWDYATEKLSAEQVQAAIAAASARGDGPPQLGAPLPATVEALAQNPRLRVLVAAGLYDSFVPCAVGEETERRLTAPMASSVRFQCYVGGHAMYLDAPSRRELAQDIRRFVHGNWPAR